MSSSNRKKSKNKNHAKGISKNIGNIGKHDSSKKASGEKAEKLSIMSKREIKLTLLALMTALFLGALDQTIVTTALPTIVSDLGSAGKLSWVISSYLLTSTVVTLLYGKLGDLYGRKKMLFIAVAIFLLGSLLCSTAGNITFLIVARGIQGIGAGGLFPLVLATISDIIPLKERAKYQGLFGAVFGISSIVGPLLGGYLTDILTWRSIFYINIPIGVVALRLIKKNLHSKEVKHKHTIDYLGSILISLSVLSLLLITIEGGKNYPWSSTPIKMLIFISIASLVCFIIWESKFKEPILPLGIFNSLTININLLISLLSGVVLFGSLVYITIYLQVIKGLSPTISGLALLPLTLGIFPSTIIAGKYISKQGKYKIFPTIGYSLITIALFFLSKITTSTPTYLILIYLFIIGLGLGNLLQVPNLVVTNLVRKENIGSAASIVTFSRSIGASFGTALFGAILNAKLSKYLSDIMSKIFAEKIDMPNNIDSFTALKRVPKPIRDLLLSAFTHALTDIFTIALYISILGLVLSLINPNKKLKEVTHPSITE